MMTHPTLSVILASFNRRDVVLNTLDTLAARGIGAGDSEIIVVDNASVDGTVDALKKRGGEVIALDRNHGACAKAFGVERARGEFLLFLDDDSTPRPGCAECMIERFRHDPHLGATAFTIHLPDGSEECSALPHVFVGCGVGLRTEAVRAAGDIDTSLFMAAEEYDLAFRLLRAGWRIELCAELQVDHLKTPHARRSERITELDIRNNLRIVARYLPDSHANIYRDDWTQRYRWLAESAGHVAMHERGLTEGIHLAERERIEYRNRRLPLGAVESVFGWQRILEQMESLARTGARRIVLADLGKNVYAFWRGARAAGLHPLAIADDRFADPSRRYRDLPIVPTADALALHADAIVVANTSYVHAERRAADLSVQTSLPVHNWFSRQTAWQCAPRRLHATHPEIAECAAAM